MPNIALVARSPHQALSIRPDGCVPVCLCANKTTYDVCVSGGIPAVLLDESLLRGDLQALNRWGYESARRWIDQQASDDARFFLESALYDLRIYFIRFLKFMIAFERVLYENKFDQIYIVDDGWSILVPLLWARFPGHVKILPVPFQPALASSSVRAMAKNTGAAMLNRLSERRMESWADQDIPMTLVSGSLRHLDGVLRHVPEGHGIVYCETSFESNKAKVCWSRGFAYCVLPDRDRVDRPWTVDAALFKAFDLTYDGRDLTTAINAALNRVLGRAFMYRPFDLESLELFLDAHAFKAVVLDEDSALRRTLFLAAERRGIPCFTVSHGIPTRRIFSQPPAWRHPAALTFVHSEFERQAYIGVGYDPAQIQVTGLPRYDRVPSLRMQAKRKTRKTILYCTGSFIEYDFIRRSAVTDTLGSTTLCREWTVRYLESLARIHHKDGRFDLWIKPHYADEADIRNDLKRIGADTKVRLFSHRADTLVLESRADVIVSPESSVVCEALLLGKPVIVLDYPGEFAGSGYDARGVVSRARNDAELERAVAEYLFDEAAHAEFTKKLAACGDFFGSNDASASERVARAIFESTLMRPMTAEKARIQ